MKMAIIISAQENNKYHKEGDLAPFGDTTLLEWKISQCKEFTDKSNIYINSDSSIIEEIAEKEEVNFFKRDINKDYMSLLLASVEQLDVDNVLSINVTSPFMGSADYQKMYDLFLERKQASVVSVEEKREYVFYENKKLNFTNSFISRNEIEPIYIMTNGCYITTKKEILENGSNVGKTPNLYKLDTFAAIEIKDIDDYSIARDLISIYFQRSVNV